MTAVERAVPGTVSWVELYTPDLVRARAFYGALLGWSFAGGDDEARHAYTMALLAGRKVAGMASLSEPAPFPPAWGVLLATDDADETARKVADAGGKVLVGPTDVRDQGRMAHFADPAGARFGVWQARAHAGAAVIDEPGAMTWHEVYSRDAALARAFYTRVFDLEERRLDAPGVDYRTLHPRSDGDRTAFGVMQMTAHMPADEPSRWNTYFQVRDVDAAAKAVTTLGGSVVAPPFDSPKGRLTFVSEPTGARFCLIAPSRA
jgi:predicted enzyme related to lactoylglutathione lyase